MRHAQLRFIIMHNIFYIYSTIATLPQIAGAFFSRCLGKKNFLKRRGDPLILKNFEREKGGPFGIKKKLQNFRVFCDYLEK